MLCHRKYCNVKKANGEYSMASIPLDCFHNVVKGTVSGGFIYSDHDFALFYGKSEEFGKPTLEEFVEFLNEGGMYLSRLVEGKQIQFSENSTFESAINNYTIVNEKFEY